MQKWICLALLLFTITLGAAELKFPIDNTWTEVEQEEGDFLKRFFLSFHEYEKDGERLTLALETRYSYDSESLAQAEGRIPGDSIEGLLRALGCDCCGGEATILSSDENSIVCAYPSGVAKLLISETHVASLIYQYRGTCLSDIIALLDTAELLDEETFPTLHYTLKLDPAKWTDVQDPLKIAQSWLSDDQSWVRAIVAPKNTLHPYQTLEAYINHLQHCWDDKMEVLEIDESSALIVTFGEQIQLEKITFGDTYVASLSFGREENKLTEKEIREWSTFFNAQKLVESQVA